MSGGPGLDSGLTAAVQQLWEQARPGALARMDSIDDAERRELAVAEALERPPLAPPRHGPPLALTRRVGSDGARGLPDRERAVSAQAATASRISASVTG